MKILTLQQRLVQFVVQFAFGEDLAQPILREEILVQDGALGDLGLLQRLHQVMQVLNDAALLGVLTFAPQEHIVFVLVLEVAIQDVQVVQREQFGSCDTALDTQREGEPRGHDDDLLEVLDQFTALPIYAVQDGQPVLQHLTVLEERHLSEHHLDG